MKINPATAETKQENTFKCYDILCCFISQGKYGKLSSLL